MPRHDARVSDPFTGQTVERARRTLSARLRTAGIDEAELDARTLLGAALGLDLTGLATQGARPLTPTEAASVAEYAARRIAGEPVARILGVREFWGLPFQLSHATLVPRPDTETVVELALEIIRERSPSTPPRIVDIGVGSGAILLALLHELSGAFGVGTDLNLDALRTAKRNAATFGLLDRAAFVACSYLDAIGGSFDLIVSNPPYIRTSDIADLSREVREHDPHLALDGGSDGLDAYRALIPQAAARLAPGGTLIVEAGQGQADDIATLMRAAALTVERPPKADLAGIPRAVSARKMPP